MYNKRVTTNQSYELFVTQILYRSIIAEKFPSNS